MQQRKVILTDMDDVLNNLVDVWIEQYQWHSNDYDLTKDKITDWNIAQFVKRGYEEKIYDLLSDKQEARIIFHSTKPQPHSVDVTKWLQQHFDLFVVTATHPNNFAVKWEWLQRYFPHIPMKNVVVLSQKDMLKGDYILDDKFDTIKHFSGKALLFSAPWNAKYSWPNRVNNWQEVKLYFEQELKSIEMQSAM